MARVTLTAGATAQLVVDSPALVPLGAEHIEAAGGKRLLLKTCHLFTDVDGARVLLARPRIFDASDLLTDAHVGISAELDIGAAAGHVGGDGDGARNAGLRDDICFLFVVAGIQDGKDLGLGSTLVAGIKRYERVWIGEVVLLPALLAQHLGQLLRLLDRRRAN